MRQKIYAFLNCINLEAVIWITGLIYLAFYNSGYNHHFTFCPLKNLGFTFCPGCGLGESISFLFRFRISESFYAHPLGIFALIILLNRIVLLLLKSYHNFSNLLSQNLGENNNGQSTHSHAKP